MVSLASPTFPDRFCIMMDFLYMLFYFSSSFNCCENSLKSGCWDICLSLHILARNYTIEDCALKDYSYTDYKVSTLSIWSKSCCLVVSSNCVLSPSKIVWTYYLRIVGIFSPYFFIFSPNDINMENSIL